MKFLKYNSNLCDHWSRSIILMVTKDCPNKCEFCIDQYNIGVKGKPDFEAITNTLLKYYDKIDNLTISGGEPLLYLHETYNLVKFLKEYNPKVEIVINSSIPYNCYVNKELFEDLVEISNGILLSAQHYKQDIADKIRNSKSKFDRNEFYRSLKNKDKYLISLNVHKPYLYEKEDVLNNIMFFNNMGFKNIKICELFESPNSYVSIDDILGIKLPQPFAVGCSNKNYDASKILPNFNGNLTLKKTCFIKSRNLNANFWDLFKTITRKPFMRKDYFFGVVQPNGEIYTHWI